MTEPLFERWIATDRKPRRVRRRLRHRGAGRRRFIDTDPTRAPRTCWCITLAYATVRIVESFVHTPAITGGAPDPIRNARVLRAPLR